MRKRRFLLLFRYLTPALLLLGVILPPGIVTVGNAASSASYNLTFSTYFGGTGNEWIRDVATDAQGNIYVAGGTQSSNFPVTAGAYDKTFNGNTDVFMAKFSPTGALVCSTFIGGPNYDRAYAIEVDGTGVYVGGRAGVGYPTTPRAAQPNFAGDNQPASAYGAQDGFITKLSLDCSQVLWSTFIGDTGYGFFRDIALDGQGNVYGALTAVTGTVALVGPGVYDTTPNGQQDGVIVKLSTGGAFLWATYFGGSGADVGTPSLRANASGVYVLGFTNSTDIPVSAGLDTSFGGVGDMHLAKFSPDGKQLLWGTYFGGTAVEFSETHGLALDAGGSIYVSVTTLSPNLATAGAYDTSYNGGGASCGNYCGDGILAKFNANGVLQAATYFGGSGGDGIEGVGVDTAGNVYIGGATYSTDLPMAGGSYQTVNRGNGDFFVAKFNSSLTQLLYSSYAGGVGVDFNRSLHADGAGNIYLGGHSSGSGNAWMVNSYQPVNAGLADAALVKFSPSGSVPPPPSDTTAPSIPSGLVSFVISSSQINLTWTASTDDVGVAGYKVYRSSGNSSFAEVATVGTPLYQDTGLTAQTTYSYTVAAYDAAENASAQSVAALGTTLGSIPPAANLTAAGSIAQIASGGTWKTLLNSINLGAALGHARMSFFDNDGNPLTLPLTFPQWPHTGTVMVSAVDRTINPGAQFIMETTGPAGPPAAIGWGQLLGTAGITGFGIFSNSANKWEAVVPLETRNASRYVLAFDNTGVLATGLAIANLGASAASVPVIIRDDTGAQMGTDSINLPALGHASFMLFERYPVTVAKRGAIEFQTPPGGRISVLGLRANGTALTTVPVLADVGTGGGSITHMLFDGGWTQSFTVVNTGVASAAATLAFFAENGDPLLTPLSLPQTGETLSAPSLTRTLAPGASLLVETVGQESRPVVVGSAQLTTTGNVSGFGVFRWILHGQEALVPLHALNAVSYILAFDNTGGLTTGLALANMANQPANVDVLIRDDTGALQQTTAIGLPGRGHISFMLPDNYAVAAGMRGTIEFVTPAGGWISVIGLRATPTGNVTTIPVLAR